MYDAAIVGAGPAGLSAALNLKLHDKSFIWFGSPALSPKVERSERVANYPGLPMVTGADLNRAFSAQIAGMDLSPTDKMVTNILYSDGHYLLLADNEVTEARALLLCTGAVTGKGIPGEADLLGRGVSYCATCDGFLYRGKDIALFCAEPRFEHEITYLAGLAGRVYLQTAYPDPGPLPSNVTPLPSPMVRVEGTERVEAVALADGARLPVSGAFFLRSAVAPAALLPGLQMDGPHIAVDRACRTNLPGCFAAGDCTGRPYQIAKAVGEGNVAAHAILDYLAQLEGPSPDPAE